MVAALALTGRNPYLSTQQKLVQARVYAQGLTIAVLIATAVFEIGDQNKGEGRYETVKVLDPDDPEHKHLIEKQVHRERYAGEDQWRDMIEAEEQKEKNRKEKIHEMEQKHKKKEKHHNDHQKEKKGSEQKEGEGGGKNGKGGKEEKHGDQKGEKKDDNSKS